MQLPRTTLRSVIDASLCRRRQQRRKIRAAQVKCWSDSQAPAWVTLIEADSKGARLMLPFSVISNDRIKVSFQDELGYYQTRTARIAWTHSVADKTVAGMAFDEDLTLAAA